MKKQFNILVAALLLALAIPVFAHENMDHGMVSPTENFTPAENPLYPVDAQVILSADHMPGMNGAIARISGAFGTTLYAITYTRSDTGEVVNDHKWVIHEEIANYGALPFNVGDTVTLLPGHISGMGGEGVQALVTQAVPGVAYMVDFSPTDGSDPVVNHQWVMEAELLPYGSVQGSPGCD